MSRVAAAGAAASGGYPEPLLDEYVVAGAAVEEVLTGAADQDVVARATEQRVVAVAADNHVVAVAAVGHEPDRVGSEARPADQFVTRPADQIVAADPVDREGVLGRVG